MAELSIVAWAQSPSFRPAGGRSKPRGRVRNGVQITPTRKRILAALGKSKAPLSAAKIRRAADVSPSTAVENLRALVRAKLVRQAGTEEAPQGGPRIPVYALAEQTGGGDDE